MIFVEIFDRCGVVALGDIQADHLAAGIQVMVVQRDAGFDFLLILYAG